MTTKYFQKILAVLPDNHHSSALLEWMGFFSDVATTAKFTVLQELPEPLEIFPADEESEPQDPATELLGQLGTVLGEGNFAHEEHHSSLLRPVLTHLSEGEFDLVLVAAQDSQGRSLAERIARKSPVGVLVVTGTRAFLPRRMLAGIDLCELSRLVLEWSEAFAALNPEGDCKLEAIHLTRIPQSARATMAISPHDLKEHILSLANQQLTEFLEANAPSPNRWRRSVLTGYTFGADLAKLGTPNDGDILVIGCHGRNALSVALLGSQAAEAIRSSECPVLVVKHKNASLGFLRHLLGLDN